MGRTTHNYGSYNSQLWVVQLIVVGRRIFAGKTQNMGRQIDETPCMCAGRFLQFGCVVPGSPQFRYGAMFFPYVCNSVSVRTEKLFRTCGKTDDFCVSCVRIPPRGMIRFAAKSDKNGIFVSRLSVNVTALCSFCQPVRGCNPVFFAWHILCKK